MAGGWENCMMRMVISNKGCFPVTILKKLLLHQCLHANFRIEAVQILTIAKQVKLVK